MTVKQSLEDWAEYIKTIVASTDIDESETDTDVEARKKRLEADPEEWFRYYFPKYTFAEPAAFHLASTTRIVERPEHYEVRLWSRELAKSTRTMMEVLYLTLAGHEVAGKDRLKKKYCLLISNSFDNATRLLMPYKLNLEFNQRIIQDYGQQQNDGKWQAAEFTTEEGVSFRALGAGQSPRGSRNEEARPDILLFDDVDTDSDCLNPDIIAKKWRWIEEAAIGTRSVSQPTTIIFCGNMIAADCCIARAVSFADHTDRRNIRDEHQRSSWPQKNTEEHIDRVLQQKSYAAAQKEYFNNPITEGAVFREMAWKPALAVNEYDALICYTDPSYTETGDYKATVLVGKIQDEYHVIKAFVEQTTTAMLLTWHQEIMINTLGAKNCRYYMEKVFMQDVIIKEINDTGAKSGMLLRILPDERKKPNKYTRIEALLEPLNRNARLYLNAKERYNPHMIRLAEQFKAFSPGSSAHDDGPDAVEGAVWLLMEQSNTRQTPFHSFGKKRRRGRL